MSGKLMLVWTEDNRSIGIIEDNDENEKYRPLIMFNFKFLGYISCESNPFRGYQVLVQTAGGNDFIITVSERELQSFVLFVSAVKSKTHGEVIQHANFDGSLWTEMIPKILLDYPDMSRKRPALNWGIQFKTLLIMAPGDKSKLMRENLEIVYPGAVYDGHGRRTEKPVHVVVPELMGNISCRILSSEDSGLTGLLQRFLPPFTSSDPQCRDQQNYALCAFIGIHHYRFIVDYIGGCPGLTFISTDPGTLKSATSKQGLLLGGDTGFLLTSTSSDPAIEAAQCQASWVTVHDDAESARGTHKTFVGAYGGGTKGLVTRSTNSEKIGGVCKTENLTKKKKWEQKTVEGREIVVHMKRNLSEASSGMSQSERYDARREHLQALAKMKLPRDYLAKFTGKHFTFESIDEKDVPFVLAHKTACALLSEARPHYGERRLGSQAIPLAIFLLLEKDVEELGDEQATALFVEAFGDRQAFFNVCITELEKSEVIIEQNMASGAEYREIDTSVEETEDLVDIPETQEEKVKGLLDLFKDKDLITLTKYIKVFTLQNSQILAIAHTKLNSDFDKIFKKMNIKPDDDNIKHIKSFTRPNAEQMSGRNTMVATVCKIFFLKNFSREFREMVVHLFNMELVEDDDNGGKDDQHTLASQDYPDHSQSRDINTMKICSCCKYKTRDNDDFKEHMSLHSKCIQCGLYFGDEVTLSQHHKAFHALTPCQKCGKEILEANMKKHMNGHEIQKDFKLVVSKGKVKARGKEREETEPKVAKVTGYRLFIKSKRPEIRNEHPDASPQDMIKYLNDAWNKEKVAGKKDEWDRKAKNGLEEDVARVVETSALVEHVGPIEENHQIMKCGICGLMIANLSVHMRNHHGEVTQTIEVADIMEADHAIEETLEGQNAIEGTEVENVENANEVIAEEDFEPGAIVMVKRKTIHWPGKVLSSNSGTIEVMVYDKARTKEKKNSKFVIPFTSDMAVCEGRGTVWVKAWKEAKLEFEAGVAKNK